MTRIDKDVQLIEEWEIKYNSIYCEENPNIYCYPGQIIECDDCSRNKNDSIFKLVIVKILLFLLICTFIYDIFSGLFFLIILLFGVVLCKIGDKIQIWADKGDSK